MVEYIFVLSDYKERCWVAYTLDQATELMLKGYFLCGFSETEEGADSLLEKLNDEWNTREG